MAQVREGDGVILDGAMYTVRELRRRTGWGVDAVRDARRDGLKVRYRGGRAFVLGRDVIAFLEECSDAEYQNARRQKQNS